MKRAHKAGLGAALALLGLGSCAPSSSDAAKGIGPAAQRLVSLNPCIDAILVEVADPEQVLALSHYSHDPRSSSIPQKVARKFAVTGGTVEEVLALNPDRVLASNFLSPATLNAFRKLDIPVEPFSSPTSVEESKEQIRGLARLSDQSSKGRALATRIDQAIRQHRAPTSAETISTVLWQSGEIVPGEATLIAEMMELAGLTSHSAKIGLGQADRLSLEQVLANPPDLLLIAGDSAGQQHPLLSKLGGTRVAYFDPKLLYCGGPTIVTAMQRLADIREGVR